MLFREHTYERRQTIASRWYLDEMVFGEIGPYQNNNGHAVNPHFNNVRKNQAVLNEVLNLVTGNWVSLISPHPLDFEELYERVKKITMAIKGAGYMVTYDVALHIGCNIYPKVLPNKYVYLVSPKVKEAAKILLPKGRYSLKVDKTLFGSMFKYFNAMDIEDLLCIYRDLIVSTGGFNPDWLQTIHIKSHHLINT